MTGKKPEILCISHKYPPSTGGMERQSYELIKGLRAYYKVHSFTYKKGDQPKVVWLAALKRHIMECLESHPEIRLIHLNDGAMASASLWMQKELDIPVVVTYHGLDVTFPLDFYQDKLIPKLEQYDAAICVSEYTRQQCLKRWFDPEHTYSVPNGVDVSLADKPDRREEITEELLSRGVDVRGKRVIIASGRSVRRKGFSWFIKNVMPSLGSDVVLLMTGPRRQEQSFMQSVTRYIPWNDLRLFLGAPTDEAELDELLETTPGVYHLGRVSFDDLMSLYSLADLFVMPNIPVEGDQEGFGLVALEASVRGTWVVASGIEGITEAVIEGANGTLLPPEEPDRWIAKIRELLSMPQQELAEWGRRGQSYTTDHFSWDRMVDGYKAVFDRYIR